MPAKNKFVIVVLSLFIVVIFSVVYVSKKSDSAASPSTDFTLEESTPGGAVPPTESLSALSEACLNYDLDKVNALIQEDLTPDATKGQTPENVEVSDGYLVGVADYLEVFYTEIVKLAGVAESTDPENLQGLTTAFDYLPGMGVALRELADGPGSNVTYSTFLQVIETYEVSEPEKDLLLQTFETNLASEAPCQRLPFIQG